MRQSCGSSSSLPEGYNPTRAQYEATCQFCVSYRTPTLVLAADPLPSDAERPAHHCDSYNHADRTTVENAAVPRPTRRGQYMRQHVSRPISALLASATMPVLATRLGVRGALARFSSGVQVRGEMCKALGGVQGGADHGSTRMSIFRCTSSGRSGATVLMAGILSSSPRTRLPDDRYTGLLDHACDSVQRVHRSSCSGCSGCRTQLRSRRGRELLSGVFRFPETETPAVAISIVAHAEAMKRPLQRHPRVTPRPAKLLSKPPVA